MNTVSALRKALELIKRLRTDVAALEQRAQEQEQTIQQLRATIDLQRDTIAKLQARWTPPQVGSLGQPIWIAPQSQAVPPDSYLRFSTTSDTAAK